MVAGTGSYHAGEAVAIVGAVVAGGCIPFFIASSKNIKKAKAGSFFTNIEKAPVLQGTVFSATSLFLRRALEYGYKKRQPSTINRQKYL